MPGLFPIWLWIWWICWSLREIREFWMWDVEMDFKEEFDKVFSNATLHWVKDHKIALANISNSLKVG